MLPTQDTLALEQLGWSSFQDLAISVCEDLLKLPAVTFSPSRDMGLDGIIEPVPGKGIYRNIVIQAKHTSSANGLSPSGVDGELSKIAALKNSLGHIDYVLVTNFRVTVATRNAVRSKFLAAGVRTFVIIGRENLIRRIRKSPSLRAMMPRLYGIGDLSQILDERRIGQAHAILNAVGGDLEKFVVTESYKRSVSALRNQRMLILLGDPAVGKSTIARCLCIAAIDEFGCKPVILESLERFLDYWDASDPKRIYWVDDAFGSTQPDEQQVSVFSRLVPMISTAMRLGARFIFTSRTYIWKSVSPKLKIEALPKYGSSMVEIDVKRFSEFERGQIVYNHVKLGDQTQDWKRQYKPFFPIVARHLEFKPEVARRLGLISFTSELRPELVSVNQFVNNPADFLEKTIAGLDKPSQAALASLLLSGGSLISPVKNDESIAAACEKYGVSFGEMRHRLESLRGSFLRLEREDDGESYWRFWHPTLGEALATVAMSNPELLDLYLEGASPSRMLREVTCSGRDVAGAILEIAPSQFGKFIKRMNEMPAHSPAVLAFLATRSTAAFRRAYFRSPPERSHPALPRWGLTGTTSIDLIHLLWQDGFLSDNLREKSKAEFLSEILSGVDTDVLDNKVRDIIGHETFDRAVNESWHKFKDEPSDIVNGLVDSIDDEVDPGDHLYTAHAFLERLIEFLPDDGREDIRSGFLEYIGERAAEISEERIRDGKGVEYDDYEGPWLMEGGRSPTGTSKSTQPIMSRDPLQSLFSDVDAE